MTILERCERIKHLADLAMAATDPVCSGSI